MANKRKAIEHYVTRLNLVWLNSKEPLPLAVRRGRLVSADRDILPSDIPILKERYGAVAADWESGAIAWVATRNQMESGAIAWVATRNQMPCLILRGVTDLVDEGGGETYGNYGLLQQRTDQVMRRILDSLAGWILQSSHRASEAA